MPLLRFLIPFMIITNTRIVHSENLTRYSSKNIIDLCDTSYTTRHKIYCYCRSTTVTSKPFVFKAECNVEESNIPFSDDIWKSFSSIKTIERLTLSSKNEYLTYIPTLALAILKDLLKLIIHNGRIEKIHSHAFANLTNLEEIKLTGNGIRILSENSFAHHSNLISITLDKNQIEEIHRNVFRRMNQLQELFLSSNNISIIHDRAFSHLENLKTLELDKNSIFILTNETFYGLENLTRLELSDNNLEVIGDNTFTPLKNLKLLNLANNKIEVLDSEAFNGLLKLESLYLGNNMIKELIDPILFTRVPLLVVLDVKSNNMTAFRYEVISPIIRNFHNTGSSLNVDENHFPCDCNLNWFLVLKNSTKNSRLQQTLDNLMCYPNPKLAEDFEKLEKSNTDEDVDNANSDYDYYDSSNMNGKLFYSDIPAKILPCDIPKKVHTEVPVTLYTKFQMDTTRTESFLITTTTENVRIPIVTESATFYNYKTTTPFTTTTTQETTTPVTKTTSQELTTPVTTSTTQETTTLPSTTRPKYFTETTTEYTTMTDIITTPRIIRTNLPKMHRNKLTHFVTEPVRTTKYPTVIKKIEPTEEMVSDGDSSIPYPSKNNEEEQANEIVSTSIPKRAYNDDKSRNIVKAIKLDSASNREENAPESMSHFHDSKTNSASSNTVSITLSLCLFLLIKF